MSEDRVGAGAMIAMLRAVRSGDGMIEDLCGLVSDSGANAFMVALWIGKIDDAVLLARSGCDPFRIDDRGQTVFQSLINPDRPGGIADRVNKIQAVLDSGALDSWTESRTAAMAQTLDDNIRIPLDILNQSPDVVGLFFDTVGLDDLADAVDRVRRSGASNGGLCTSPEWELYIMRRAAAGERPAAPSRVSRVL